MEAGETHQLEDGEIVGSQAFEKSPSGENLGKDSSNKIQSGLGNNEVEEVSKNDETEGREKEDRDSGSWLEAGSPKWLLGVQIGSTKDVTGWSIWSEIDLRNLILLEPGRFEGIRELPWDLTGCLIGTDVVPDLKRKELLNINVSLLQIRQI
ncbi:hypothetical protein F2Q69_00046303 [Brassica cretica]|uniref:Uncharacterized protein n=1 Tax=Brassica cretica TaxID=69181 RepID=A0A8S9Q2G6_BRACR|nr:hypothetical protein F2Q69_00046303 [Brassica cretica]